MDWITLLSIGGSVAGLISVPTVIAFYTDKLPFVKILWFKIFNKNYNVKLKGVKEYEIFSYDLKTIKKIILTRYPKTEITTPKKNSMTVQIRDMQAPYKISFLPNFDSAGETLKVKITLNGTVKFSYRNTKSNKKNLITLNSLFNIIEEQHQIMPKFKWFSLEAYTSELKDKPFKKDFERISCEDTKIEIDKTNNFMKINSDSINYIIDCLNSNIKKII